MGLLIDLRGQRHGHRFWKRKLEVASKVTDPLSHAAWPPSPLRSSPQAIAQQHFERAALRHREPHLFGASASTEPPSGKSDPSLFHQNSELDKEKLRERQRRYKQQLDEQVRNVLSRRLQEKKLEGNTYDGGIFRRLGEHVVHDRSQSPMAHHRKVLEDLDEQIRLKEARLIAEYEAGQRNDAKAQTEPFLLPEHDRDPFLDTPRRFHHRSLLQLSGVLTPKDARHPPWAVEDAITSTPRDFKNGKYQPAVVKSSRKPSRQLFSESSERLDKILMDFLDEPVEL